MSGKEVGRRMPPPVTPAADDQHDDEELAPELVEELRRAVEDPSLDRPPPVVEERLAQLARVRQARATLQGEHLHEVLDSLSRYAYQVVAGWFSIIFDSGLSELPDGVAPVTYDDLGDLASDTVTRAAVGFEEEIAHGRPWLREEDPDLRRLFLAECLLHVFDAYQRWLREKDLVSWDEAEQIGSDSAVPQPAPLLRRLFHLVVHDRDRVVHRLRQTDLPGAGSPAMPPSEVAATEIVDATVDVLTAAARDWADRTGEY